MKLSKLKTYPFIKPALYGFSCGCFMFCLSLGVSAIASPSFSSDTVSSEDSLSVEDQVSSEVVMDTDKHIVLADISWDSPFDSVVSSTTNYSASELAISKSDEPVFMFKNNSLSGDVCGMLPVNGAGKVLVNGGSWLLIQSGEFSGFVDSTLFITGDSAIEYAEEHFTKTLTIASNTSYIYSSPDVNSFVLGVYSYNEIFTSDELKDGFFHVLLETGGEGYICESDVNVAINYELADEVDILLYADAFPDDSVSLYGSSSAYDAAFGPNCSDIFTGAAYDSTRQMVVDFASQFVGNPYVWGGTSLTEGCDCSGFVMSIYQHFGVSLPHSSKSIRSYGSLVCEGYDSSVMLPGDIICYEGHVSIYIGNEQMIEAKNKKSGIVISDASRRTDAVCVRRVLVGHSVSSDVSERDYDALCRIVEAEAGTEGFQGKVYVADVILNRVSNPRFSQNTIYDVIYAPKQFQPVSNGRIDTVTVTEETIEAVDFALSHTDSTMGALYFMNPNYSDPDNVAWFHSSLTYLFNYNDSEFFK